MKTLTPLEILDKLETKKSILGVQGTEIAIKACELYAAQFQSQPSISAEEFLKEKGIDFGKHGIIETKEGIVELLTEFASRQGKVVEIKKEDGNK